MFLGHLATGLAAKRLVPKTNAAVLLIASEFIDVLFPLFVLLGWERVWVGPGNAFTRANFYYPFSHSLAAALAWTALAALAYLAVTRNRRGAAVIALVVLGHWVLDFVSHKPDMPLAPGNSPVVGLGLWYSLTATIVVEGLMFAAGAWIYLASTRARNWKGVFGFWAFAIAMVAIFFADMNAPPPPDAAAFAWVGLAFNLFFVLAWWFDRNRKSKIQAQPVAAAA